MRACFVTHVKFASIRRQVESRSCEFASCCKLPSMHLWEMRQVCPAEDVLTVQKQMPSERRSQAAVFCKSVSQCFGRFSKIAFDGSSNPKSF